MDRLLAPLLSPLLIAQALRLRARALRLPEPPGPRRGELGRGPDLRLLILGDSSAAGVGAAHQGEALSGQLAAALAPHRRLTWQLEARTGATSRSTLTRLETLPRQHFDIVLLVLGVNDVTSFAPLTRILADRAQIAQEVAARLNTPNLIITGIPPLAQFPLLPDPLRWILGQRAARLERQLHAQAERAGHLYLPFSMPMQPDLMAEDGFHPAPQAYALWAKALTPHLLMTAPRAPGSSAPPGS
ncbi:SGNH/GDSL hydrolase family protein [Nioella sp. MMSF_3534]|uniref:SGNH/GDSL hydrolase family protein n=1 Tax=Nioella sp. MMSF_3534 TaxID=3046720 RepID=UPI00273FEEFD|nr:SGNH/GDSL hydrolase family protein [Nioella sp. MMSF_3534]